uniref:Uncharacterized protein n=1 Tax=Panagrolaimus superbus TaxID=310955 RepID=A0A914Y358_9BILA
MEKQYSIPIGYIAGPLVAIVVILCLLGCMLFFFVARSKRANQGHYSPSNQEQTGGARMQMFTMEAQKIQLPPNKSMPERLI